MDIAVANNVVGQCEEESDGQKPESSFKSK
jgi:hypothetical protein